MKKHRDKEVVIKVEDLSISFSTDHGRLHAVRGVSFELYRGEVLAIVGESGSGKSVSAKTIMGILAPNGRVEGGRIMYGGEDLTKVSEEEFHRIRGKKIGMIFQDPLSSLNPIMRIGKQITEAIIINGNKLKLMYEDLIYEDNVAYRNALTKARGEIDTSAFQLRNLKIENKYKARAIREDKSLTGADKRAKLDELIEQIKAADMKHRALTKRIKAEYKPILAELKAKLKVAQKKAKAEVKAYHNELKAEYKKERDALRAEYKATKNVERRKELRASLKKARLDYVDKTRVTRQVAHDMAVKVMEEVGIPNAARRFRQYTFEFSVWMRQRIVIAIALIQNPDILICDEPTTALDVTIQAQILELLLRLKHERQLSIIFITHDLGVVANMADRVAVMYAGRIVEYGKVEEIFYNPKHPYTWALLSSIPDVDTKERLEAIPGTPPNMVYPPKGDAFAPRSKYAMAVDFIEEPPYFQVSETHFARTWLLDPRAPKVEMPKIVSERIRISLERAGKGEQFNG